MPSTLFCFDFDLTLTRSHLFHFVVQHIHMGFSREEACLKATQAIRYGEIKHPELLWSTLYQILKGGHGMVVTTFTAFPELPLALLQDGVKPIRRLGGGREITRWLSRAMVIYGDPAPIYCPDRPPPHSIYVPQSEGGAGEEGKCPHILKALNALKERGDVFERVVLIDDSPLNIRCAQESGYETVLVPKDERSDGYFQEILKFI